MDRLIDMLKRHEGYRRKPYRDSVGKLTVAIGRNLEGVGISEAEAEYLLQNDIRLATEGLRNRFTAFDDLDAVRQAALIDMCFNLGIIGLMQFQNMLANLSAKNWDAAANEALNSKWAGQVGARAKELAEMLRTGEWQDAAK